MTFRDQLLRRPQSLLLRRVLFQVHQWTGLGTGLYVLAMSISGSLLVFQGELFRAFYPKPVVVASTGVRMTFEELRQSALRAYPDYRVTDVFEKDKPAYAVEIRLVRGKQRKFRLFDPYTGADLGNSLGAPYLFLGWLVELHNNLLYGDTGRLINAVGGLCVTLLCITGACIWWPGIKSWRHSLTFGWKANWRRFNWELHSSLGFWFLAITFVWGISGVYLSYPEPFHAVADFIDPVHALDTDWALLWLTRLHFGNFGGLLVKALWAILALVPVVLFCTGMVVWWNRVIRRGVLQTNAVPSAGSLRSQELPR